MSNKLVFILVIFYLFISDTYAQGTWEVFTKENGLKSNSIHQIFKDSSGNLWFKTAQKGITKFDGKNWTNYFSKGKWDQTTFFEDSNGTVWIGARSAEYVQANGIWKLTGDDFERIIRVGVNFIEEDSEGRIWFGGKKLCSYDGVSVTEYSKKETGDNQITALYIDNLDNIWVGTRSGVVKYNGKSWIQFSDQLKSLKCQVNSIITDTNGNIWLGAEDGVFKYDGVKWTHFTKKNGLVDNETLMLRMDSRNKIYAIAGKPVKQGYKFFSDDFKAIFAKFGLSTFEGKKWKPFSDVAGVPDNVGAFYIEDKSGNLWFNSKDKTIYKFDGKIWTSYNETNGFKSDWFSAVLEDSFGNYWFGGSGIEKYDGENWSQFNKDTGLPSNSITSIMEDNDGNIWFGTFKGIVKYKKDMQQEPGR